jgi:heme-degrading monooxygenase HmoA
MLLERAELLMKEGREEDFAAAMRERGLALLAGVPGVQSVKLGRGVENPGKFMLLVRWEAMEAHAAFSKSPVSKDFRELISPYSKGGSMEHFEMDDAP